MGKRPSGGTRHTVMRRAVSVNTLERVDDFYLPICCRYWYICCCYCCCYKCCFVALVVVVAVTTSITALLGAALRHLGHEPLAASFIAYLTHITHTHTHTHTMIHRHTHTHLHGALNLLPSRQFGFSPNFFCGVHVAPVVGGFVVVVVVLLFTRFPAPK